MPTILDPPKPGERKGGTEKEIPKTSPRRTGRPEKPLFIPDPGEEWGDEEEYDDWIDFF
jgi:hypothetical protein